MQLLNDVLDRPVAIPDRHETRAAQVDVLEIVRAGLRVNGRAGIVALARVGVFQAAVLVRVREQRARSSPLQYMIMPCVLVPGAASGKLERVLHVQARAVVPDHARIGPEEAFLAVRKPVGDAVDAHRGRAAGR